MHTVMGVEISGAPSVDVVPCLHLLPSDLVRQHSHYYFGNGFCYSLSRILSSPLLPSPPLSFDSIPSDGDGPRFSSFYLLSLEVFSFPFLFLFLA